MQKVWVAGSLNCAFSKMLASSSTSAADVAATMPFRSGQDMVMMKTVMGELQLSARFDSNECYRYTQSLSLIHI